jgi:hypothetical protein
MTNREWNLVKEAIARTRYELGNRVAPGPQDGWRNNHDGDGVTPSDATLIRQYSRAAVYGDHSAMRRIPIA